jgi:putative ABC transport system ATP-binding protein
MLQLKDITVSLGNNDVLRNLSCHVEEGDCIAIVGANGAGKSTLFDTISGKILPNSGSIFLDKAEVTSLNEKKRSSMITRIFQNVNLNSVGSLTVAENLSLAHYSRRPARLVSGMKAMKRSQAEEIIHDLAMPLHILDTPMHYLSGGQRQLLAFTMAIQLTPKLLLLDEPTAALDPQAATKLLTHAARFIRAHKITTLLITHDPHIALSMGNKIWILKDGKISQQFNAEEKKLINPEQLIGQIDYAQLVL